MHEFRILGPVDVVVDGRSVALPGARQRALLAILLLHAGEVVSSDRLIDELWGEQPPDGAANTLQATVSRLRKLIHTQNGAQLLVTRPPGYVLEIEPDQLDLRRFETLVAEGRAALAAGDTDLAAETLREALSLWRGPPLADLELGAITDPVVARLEDARLAALEQRIEADLERGEHAVLVGELEALAAEHPYRETFRRQLMLALYRSRRQAEALEVYRATRRLLADELGLEPSEDLQQLHRRILSHEEPLAPEAERRPGTAPDRHRAVRGRPRSHRIAALGVVVAIGAGAAAVVLSSRGSGSTSPRSVRVVANSLVKLDPASGRVLSDTAVGDRPVGLTIAGGDVWVVNRGDRTVSQIDSGSRRMRTIGGARFAYDVAADSHGNVWSSGGRDRLVTRMTSGGGTFPAQPSAAEAIRVPFFAGAIAVGGGYLWVANAGATTQQVTSRTVEVGRDSVSRIDLGTHRPSPPIRVGRLPFSIAFGYGSAWVVDLGANSLSVIRAGSNESETIPLRLDVDDAALDVSAGAGGVWVVSRDGKVIRIDPESRRIVATIAPRTETDESFAISAGPHFVWLTGRADVSVSKIDPRSNRVVRTIRLGRVGAVPCGVAAGSAAIWLTIGPDTDCGSPATR